jgi:dipeptidase D
MENLEPSVVWKFFGEITQIPRPSKKEEKIREYLLDVAQQYRLEAKTDQAGNVLICKPATFGYENHKKIILQSHMDMVCEKDGDVQHNFDSNPIQTFINND